jgi:hypothetical protein
MDALREPTASCLPDCVHRAGGLRNNQYRHKQLGLVKEEFIT